MTRVKRSEIVIYDLPGTQREKEINTGRLLCREITPFSCPMHSHRIHLDSWVHCENGSRNGWIITESSSGLEQLLSGGLLVLINKQPEDFWWRGPHGANRWDRYNIYWRGNVVPARWGFGEYDIPTKKYFLVHVLHREADTLLPIIQRHILPETQCYVEGTPTYCKPATTLFRYNGDFFKTGSLNPRRGQFLYNHINSVSFWKIYAGVVA